MGPKRRQQFKSAVIFGCNCFIDGTSLTGGGKATGHAIQVRNPVFDVRFDRTYVWNYTGNGFDMVVDNAATPIRIWPGVFTTFSDGKIFNCDGAGILIGCRCRQHRRPSYQYAFRPP